MKPYFDLSELKQRLSEHGISADTSRVLFPMLFEEIAKGLAEQDTAGLANFGRFKLVPRAERTYVLNGEKYTVPAHFDIEFNPDPDFCRAVNAVLEEIDPEGLRVRDNQD